MNRRSSLALAGVPELRFALQYATAPAGDPRVVPCTMFSMNRRSPRICLFCGRSASGQGEHVLPQWLQGEHDPHGPYTLEVNGEPERNREGAVRHVPHTRVFLRSVCGSGDAQDSCNSWLEHTFEMPGREYVLQVIGDMPAIDADGTARLARWFMKTLLLLAHPQIEHVGFMTKPPLAWSNFPDTWLPDLRQHGQFPADMSLWMAIHDARDGTGQLQDAGHIELGRTHYNDDPDSGGRGNTSNFAIATVDHRRYVHLQLVYHPLSVVTHPFEQAGLATRLWPNPSSRLDLPGHPLLNHTGVEQWQNTFVIGASSIGVRPGHALDLTVSHSWPPPEVCLHP